VKQISKSMYQNENKDVTQRWNCQHYDDDDFGGGSGGESGTVMWWQ
jgi:hypothetical protein